MPDTNPLPAPGLHGARMAAPATPTGSEPPPAPSPTRPVRATDNPYRNIGDKDRGPQPIGSSSSYGHNEARTFSGRPAYEGQVIVHGRPSLRRPTMHAGPPMQSVRREASDRPRTFLFRGY